MKTITNQEIMNIVENNDATNRENYNAVKSVEDRAKDITTTKVKKTIQYWNNSNYDTFCREVKKLIK